jgi:hypothetical protein
MTGLFLWHVNLSSVDGIDNVMWWLAINRAAYGLGSTQDFLDASSEILRERLGSHSPCNLVNLIERDVTRVLDVLLLFAIPRGLCKSAKSPPNVRMRFRKDTTG